MKRFFWVALASVGLGSWLAAPASAQFGGYQRPYRNPYPTFSPILNMRGGSPVTNYFGIVRPQMQTNQALQTLELQQQAMLSAPLAGQPMTAPEGQPVMLITGHPVGFNDYTRYFPVQGFRTGGAQATPYGAPFGARGGFNPVLTGAAGFVTR